MLQRVSWGGITTNTHNFTTMSFVKYPDELLKSLIRRGFVRECFDFAYTGIKVNESGTKVLLTTNAGDTLVINLESYIHNELMNYSNEYKDIFEV